MGRFILNQTCLNLQTESAKRVGSVSQSSYSQLFKVETLPIERKNTSLGNLSMFNRLHFRHSAENYGIALRMERSPIQSVIEKGNTPNGADNSYSARRQNHHRPDS